MPAFRPPFALVLLALLGHNAAASAQTPAAPASGDSPLLSEAAQLLQSASLMNGFASRDAQPWHLRATYDLLSVEGSKPEHGVYEASWLNPSTFKQSFASPSFNQVEYHTAKGLFRTGDLQTPLLPERIVPNQILFRVPAPALLHNVTLDMQTRSILNATLRCVEFLTAQKISESKVPTLCFDLVRPTLFYSAGLGQSIAETGGTSRSQVQLFRGHFVARSLSVRLFDLPYLNIHIEILEDLASPNEAAFEPPLNATPATPVRPFVPALEMAKRITKSAKPAWGIAGYGPKGAPAVVRTGLLDVVIGADGLVKTVKPICAPDSILKAEMETVHKNVYQPWLVAGQPVEVETEVAYQITTH